MSNGWWADLIRVDFVSISVAGGDKPGKRSGDVTALAKNNPFTTCTHIWNKWQLNRYLLVVLLFSRTPLNIHATVTRTPPTKNTHKNSYKKPTITRPFPHTPLYEYLYTIERVYGVERVMMSGTGTLLSPYIQPHTSRLWSRPTYKADHRTPASTLSSPLDK